MAGLHAAKLDLRNSMQCASDHMFPYDTKPIAGTGHLLLHPGSIVPKAAGVLTCFCIWLVQHIPAML